MAAKIYCYWPGDRYSHNAIGEDGQQENRKVWIFIDPAAHTLCWDWF
jgi:hypothetical protein